MIRVIACLLAAVAVWKLGFQRAPEYFLVIPYLTDEPCRLISDPPKLSVNLPGRFCDINADGVLLATDDEISFFRHDGSLAWHQYVRLHHDLDYDELSGETFFPAKELEQRYGRRHKLDHVIGISRDGREIFRWRAEEHLIELRRIFGSAFSPTYIKEMNYFESTFINAVDRIGPNALSAKFNPLRSGNILINLNGHGFIILDRESKEIVWHYRYSPTYAGQTHSPRVLANGHILFLLNDDELRKGHSRVVEIDPHDAEMEWSYSAPEPATFHNSRFGSAFRLPNENTLVTHVLENHGEAFIVTQSGRIVWRWKEDTPVYRVLKVPAEQVERSGLIGLLYRPL